MTAWNAEGLPTPLQRLPGSDAPPSCRSTLGCAHRRDISAAAYCEAILRMAPVGLTCVRIGVLMACHDRRAKTLLCLRALFGQDDADAIHIDVYLVDDGSTDGTAESVTSAFPRVHLIRGNGRLFWNGAMRLAFEHALRGTYQYYLWLNDDTVLQHTALQTLLAAHKILAARGLERSIIVGSTCDPSTGALTYGGWVSQRKTPRGKWKKLVPGREPMPCETMNGNCVLVPRSVADRVGNLDSAFVHGLGDLDYGLRAAKAGCGIWVAPGYVGSCAANSTSAAWNDPTISRAERWKHLVGPKGLPPAAWLTYSRRHAGYWWPLQWVAPYIELWLKPRSRSHPHAQH